MLPLRALCIAAAWTLLAGTIGAQTQEVSRPPLSRGEIEQRLKELSPTFVAPTLDYLASPSAESLPPLLLGIDLVQEGGLIVGIPASLDGNKPLDIVCYWLPLTQIDRPSLGSIQMTDLALTPLVRSEFPIKAGPAKSDQPWRPWSVHKQTYSIDLPKAATHFSGRGSLVVELLKTAAHLNQKRPLMQTPIHISPYKRSPAISEDRLRELTGGRVRILPARTRLGEDAELRLTLPSVLTSDTRRLAIVSTYFFQSLPQGEDAFYLSLTRGGEEVASWALQSGVHVARSDHAYYSAANINHELPPVFAERDANYPSQDGRPFSLRQYLAQFEIPTEAQGADTLVLRCARALTVEVYGVALIEDGAGL